ncbi:hypothetical protein [Solemya elarraichensis gill symbiont]|nr:hypothetical protein [Solemya elarraichensis gill symbiont]
MNKLVASLAVLALVSAAHLQASELAEGFDWPAGFSEKSAVESTDTEVSDGMDWPAGFNTVPEASQEKRVSVAEGMDWPEGFKI